MSSTNKNTRLHRSSLLACSLSLMIGLSGCGDSGELSQSEVDGGTQGTSSGTDENHDNNSNQGNDVNQDTEDDEHLMGKVKKIVEHLILKITQILVMEDLI